MDAPHVVRAKLIPMRGTRPDTDESSHIDVQFNPSTLRVTLANTLKAARGNGAAQYADKSESTLSVELVFDTSVDAEYGGGSGGSRSVAANTDVRTLTRKIAETFMNPKDGRGQPRALKRCRFQWGSFQFTGLLASYGETLDYFAPEGIPLRATLALSFKEDKYQFEQIDVQAARRAPPVLASGGDGLTAADITQGAGGDPREWRSVAELNDMDNPRFTSPNGVLRPGGLSSGTGNSGTSGGR